jgi:outer membrane protein OmpA-like peptidoglycan-associated protein
MFMFSSNLRFSQFGLLILTGSMALSGCATKAYVKTQIDPLSARLTTTDNKVKENSERIDAVDRRAQQGITAAAAADTKATAAGQAAQAADTKATNAQRAADTASQGVQAATTRITNVENRMNSIDTYMPSGQPVAVTFKVNSSVLSADAKKSLDDVAGQVANSKFGFVLQVQGFTDGSGSESYNDTLSDRRAESVKRYLVTKSVPAYRVSIVGLGKADPVADNKTRKGREQNRRVEVQILKSAEGHTGS